MKFHLVWLDKASRLTPRYEGTRDVLLKQEAMLDKYKKGGKHLLLVFTSYSIIKLSLFVDAYLTSSKMITTEYQLFTYCMVQI